MPLFSEPAGRARRPSLQSRASFGSRASVASAGTAKSFGSLRTAHSVEERPVARRSSVKAVVDTGQRRGSASSKASLSRSMSSLKSARSSIGSRNDLEWRAVKKATPKKAAEPERGVGGGGRPKKFIQIRLGDASQPPPTRAARSTPGQVDAGAGRRRASDGVARGGGAVAHHHHHSSIDSVDASILTVDDDEEDERGRLDEFGVSDLGETTDTPDEPGSRRGSFEMLRPLSGLSLSLIPEAGETGAVSESGHPKPTNAAAGAVGNGEKQLGPTVSQSASLDDLLMAKRLAAATGAAAMPPPRRQPSRDSKASMEQGRHSRRPSADTSIASSLRERRLSRDVKPPAAAPSSSPARRKKRGISERQPESSGSIVSTRASRAQLLKRRSNVRRTAAAEGEKRCGRRQDADSLAALEEAEWMAARARLIKATLQTLPLDKVLPGNVDGGETEESRLVPQREALQVALQEGGNSLMHESFHLVVLLRRAVAEIGEQEEKVREARGRAEAAERRLEEALDDIERWKREREAWASEKKEAEAALEAEKERRRAVEEQVAALQAKIEVIVGWARAEEEGRAAAQAQAEQGEEVAARLSAKVEELQSSLRDREGLLQKLRLDQEALGGKCADIAKELHQALQRAGAADKLAESKQNEAARLQATVKQQASDIDEFKVLLQKNERRSILLLEQLKKLSDENIALMRRIGELGRDGGADSAAPALSSSAAHHAQLAEARQGRVSVLEQQLKMVEVRAKELEERLQKEVKDRGSVRVESEELRAKLDAAQSKMDHMEEVLRAKDQAIRALQQTLHQTSTTTPMPPPPPQAQQHTANSPTLTGSGGSFTSSPTRTASTYRYFSLLSVPHSPGTLAKSA